MIAVLLDVSLWAKMTSWTHFQSGKHEDQKKRKECRSLCNVHGCSLHLQQTNGLRSDGND